MLSQKELTDLLARQGVKVVKNNLSSEQKAKLVSLLKRNYDIEGIKIIPRRPDPNHPKNVYGNNVAIGNIGPDYLGLIRENNPRFRKYHKELEEIARQI